MSVNLIVNGVSFPYPSTGDSLWGDNATNWASAVTSGMLQKAGGTFTLAADVDFGASFGLKSVYYKSRATNPSSSGTLRLGKTDSIGYRNNANGADLLLAIDGSDNLTFDGNALINDTDIIPTANGGTGLTSYTQGNLLYASATNVLAKLAIGAANTSLLSTGTIPGWDFIKNVNVDAAAAIAYSKLNLSNSILNADVNSSAAIAYSKLSLSGSILNADVNSSAAIDFSKLAALTSANILVGSAGNVATSVSVTGDVTISNSGVTAIGSNKVANSQLAQMASHTFKGNNTGSTANAADLTATQLTAELNEFVGDSGSGGTKGLVPAPTTGDATKFLKGNKTWATVTATPAAWAAKSASYTLTTNENAVGFTTGSSTLDATLPTAASISGQQFTIKKVDSGSGKVVLKTTSAQTIDGFASAALELHTINESVTVQSDGANWQILDHRCDTSWVAYTPTFTGFGTVSSVTAYSRRAGANLEVMISATAGTPTATEARCSIGFNGTDGNVTSDASVPATLSVAGAMTHAANGNNVFYPLIESSVSYLTFGIQNSGASAGVKMNGSAFPTSTPFKILALIPISGWFA